MSRTGRTENRQGLALVEVLVAVVIFFGASGALLGVYALAATALDAAEATVGSTLAAQERLEGLVLVPTNAVPAEGRTAEPVLSGYECRVGTREVSGMSATLVEVELRAGLAGQDASAILWTRTVSAPP